MAITITQADIEAVWGTVFVAQWSNTGGVVQSPAVNTTRVNTAIRLGNSYVNGRVNNGPYAIPLTANDPTSPPPEVIDCMATYAGWWLFKTSGIKYTKDTLAWVDGNKARIERLMMAIRIGDYPLDATFNTGRQQTPRVASGW